ncbi:hypothetical protein GQ457_02G027480 [Hibiscus cannabinus]
MGNLVTWRSKKQYVISRSSAEAEFRALAQGICEGIWLLKLLREVDPNSADYFELLSDNNSAIQIAKNPVQHDRTKHVEIDRHFIAEKIKKGTAKLFYIPTDGQLADSLTKALPKPAFDSFKCKLDLNQPRKSAQARPVVSGPDIPFIIQLKQIIEAPR